MTLINKYTTINRLTWHQPIDNINYMNVLRTIHNAGFFSCCSIRLIDIMIYFNDNHGLPDMVDSSEQFMLYKTYATDNLIPLYFNINEKIEIEYIGRKELTYAKEEPQFSDYRLIDFDNVKPFIDKYFTPSDYVLGRVKAFEEKYKLQYDNLCAVFYRGNDKFTETKIGSHEEFINQAIDIQRQTSNIKFLVLPDETEFLITFKDALGAENVITFDETPSIRKQQTAVFYTIPQNERAEYGVNFFSAVLCASKCKHLVVHSGNGGCWAILYRGHADNVRQFLIYKWI